jgi:prostatic aicd phosphatase
LTQSLYAAFLSLFNMTEVTNPNLVDYASVMVYEIHNSTAGELSVSMSL